MKLIKLLNIMSTLNEELKVSACKKTKIYYSYSGACKIIVYEIASLPIWCFGKMTKQNKLNKLAKL